MKAQVQLLLTFQLVIMLIYILLVHWLNLGDLLSALTGCLASIVPTIYFSIRMLRHKQDDDAQAFLGHAYRSDIGKWLLAIIIFAVAFSSEYQWDPSILFGGYLLVQLSAMFVPLINKR